MDFKSFKSVFMDLYVEIPVIHIYISATKFYDPIGIHFPLY